MSGVERVRDEEQRKGNTKRDRGQKRNSLFIIIGQCVWGALVWVGKGDRVNT